MFQLIEGFGDYATWRMGQSMKWALSLPSSDIKLPSDRQDSLHYTKPTVMARKAKNRKNDKRARASRRANRG